MANADHLAILKQGVEVWNTWRKENSKITPDLSRVDFNVDDFNGIDLRCVNFHATNLERAIFLATNLVRANFCEATLNMASFCGVNLSGADFSAANLSGAFLKDARLVDSKFIGANFHQADLYNTILQFANFSKANLTEASFIEAQASKVDFSDSDFTGACLEGWRFSESKFNRVSCLYIYQGNFNQERQPPHRNYEQGEFARHCQEEQSRETRRYIDTAIRFEKDEQDEPDENLKKLVKLINAATIEAIFDPYFENEALNNLAKLKGFGASISSEIRVLTSSEVIKPRKSKAPRLSKAHEEKTFQALSTVGEIRLIDEEHRRFILLSGGVSLIIGMSLNQFSKNEAASLESDRDDRAFFDSQWSSAQVFN